MADFLDNILIRKDPSGFVRLKEIGLEIGDSVLIQDPSIGVRSWKCRIKGLCEKYISFVSEEYRLKPLPFKRGNEMRISYLAGEQVAVFSSRVLKNDDRLEPPEVWGTLPSDVLWKEKFRRKSPRLKISLPGKVKVALPGSSWVPVRIVDVSKSGICFHSASFFGKFVMVNVISLSRLFHQDFWGKIVRISEIDRTLEPEDYKYEVGVEFEGLSSLQNRKLDEFLSNIFRQGDVNPDEV